MKFIRTHKGCWIFTIKNDIGYSFILRLGFVKGKIYRADCFIDYSSGGWVKCEYMRNRRKFLIDSLNRYKCDLHTRIFTLPQIKELQ